MTSSPTLICVTCSRGWSTDTRSTVSANCCRGRGKPEILSRAERSARPGRLRWGPFGQRGSIPNLRYAFRACDGVRGPSSRARLARQAHEKTLRLGASAERSTMRRTPGERSGCTLAAGNSASGGVSGAGQTASREPTRSDRKRRRFGRRTVGRRSLARASRHRPASPPAAAGLSPDARRSGPGLHCRRRGTPDEP